METSATSRLEDPREAGGGAVRGFDPASSLLLTDLYELNMMQAYLEAGMTEPAVFEFFVRKLPESRGFLMAAGLEQVVEVVRGFEGEPPGLALPAEGVGSEWFQRAHRSSRGWAGPDNPAQVSGSRESALYELTMLYALS